MHRRLVLAVTLLLVMSACSSSESSDTTTTSSTTTSSTLGPTTTPSTTTTTVPDLPTSTVSYDLIGQLPDGVIAFGFARSPDVMVVAGWFDKVPGVAGVRPAILSSADGTTWDTVSLEPFVLDSDFLDPTGVVWTGSEFLVTTEGTSLGVSGVLFSSPDGSMWSRATLDIDVLDTSMTRGRSATHLVWTPELIQSAGDVGLASIGRAGDEIVIGGWALLGSQPTPLIWTSTDGSSWAVSRLPGSNEIVRSVEVGRDAVVVRGLGQGPAGGLYDVAWQSEDLVDWDRIDYQIKDLEFVLDAAHGPDGHLIRATTYTSEGPRWWHSPDGTSWSPADLPFDLVSSWHDRWIAVTCAGGSADLFTASNHSMWTDSGTVDGCPARVMRDGSEIVFLDDTGHLWGRVIPRWDGADMVSAVDAERAAVVFVASDDVLNVRAGAGVVNPVIGSLDPHADRVPTTGAQLEVDGSEWVEILTPAGSGWVNSYYLIPDMTDDEFLGDPRVDDLIDALATAFAFGDGLGDVVSRRGLIIDYFGTRHRFLLPELLGLVRSTDTRKWGSNAANIEEVPEWTFARAVGDPFIGIYTDDDRLVAYDQVLPGGNGSLPDFIVPFDLKAAHFVAFHDPGDNPEFGGIDWYAWYVYVTFEDGEPKVLAMSNDAWGP